MYKEKVDLKIKEVLGSKIDNKVLLKLYYDLGEILNSKKSNELKELELYLKSKYGIVIGFTARNFKNMINFYNDFKTNYNQDLLWKDLINKNYTKNNNNDILEELIKLKNSLENTK